MKMNIYTYAFYFVLSTISLNPFNTVTAQQANQLPVKSAFWGKVQFGGGLGLSFGDFTNITVAPAAIYNFNKYVAAGLGLQGSYVSARESYKSTILGGSLIGLFSPLQEVQLSVEVEQLNVSASAQALGANEIKTNFWTTAVFVGGGYNTGNVTIGGRYNLLFDKNKSAYSTAFMPFVRVFF